MNLSALQKLKADGDSFLDGKDIKELHGQLIINGLAPMLIKPSLSFNRSSDINLELGGINFGRIKFLSHGSEKDIYSLPDDERISFFKEYDKEEIVNSKHIFKNDFVLINEGNLQDYLSKFKNTSPVWGSFFHLENLPVIEFNKKISTTAIELIDNIEINNQTYFDNLFLSIQEPNPMNRFLKLYHLLELQFDMHTAILIKDLLVAGGKEKEISSRLKDYTRNEDERLESLIKARCTDFNRLSFLLNNVKSFITKATTIFYEYGKERNPLKKADFNLVSTVSPFFEKPLVESKGYHFEALIPKVTAYWIYRVRCCVAHNRFGEYIMTSNDEEFIVEFAEPLLKEAVIQCFKK